MTTAKHVSRDIGPVTLNEDIINTLNIYYHFMTRSKLFLVTLLMSVSVLASAAVKIVPEPLEIKELSGKVSLPSELTVSALENDNMVDTYYIELSSGILKNNGITLKKGGRNSFVRLSVSDKVNDKGAYMINVGKATSTSWYMSLMEDSILRRKSGRSHGLPLQVFPDIRISSAV